jgi:hypothetical protein
MPDDEQPPGLAAASRRARRALQAPHRLHGPVALYGGRIDPGKGCES